MRFNSHNTREKNTKTIFIALKSIARRFSSISKVIIPVFAVLTLTCGYLVYAYTIDTTEYVLQTLKVIPTSISSETWANVEQAGVQDLNSDALVQSFNGGNSATIDFEKYYPKPEPEPEVFETPVIVAPDAQPVTPPQQAGEEQVLGENLDSPIDTALEAEPEISDEPVEEIVEPVVSEPEVQEVEVPAPEEVDGGGNEVTAFRQATKNFFTALSTAVEMFPFVNSSTSVAVEPEPAEETQSTEGVVLPEEVIQEQQEVSEQGPDLEEDVVVEPDVEIEDEETQDDVVVDDAQASSSNEVQVPATDDVIASTSDVTVDETALLDGFSEEQTASSSDPVTPEEIVPEFTLPACLQEEGCQSHELLFEGFDIPDIEGGSRIENIQVRLSLGAQALTSVNTIQRLRVQYTFDEVWSDAEIIDLTSEVANSVNGDYYLLALPTVDKITALDTLKIRLVYEGDVTQMRELFVDALWLEVSAGEFFEPPKLDEFTDKITYERLLAEPEINEFTNPLTDFAVHDAPEFSLKFKSQKNFVMRVFDNFFSDRTFTIEKVTLKHPVWGDMEADFAVEYYDDETWSLKLARQPQKIRPGKYTIELQIDEDGELYTDTFEFYWGVLAVNTTKSMYHQNEEVTLNLAALTDKGDTICDGDLRLKITDPTFSIFELDVNQTGFCGPNNVTDMPDYVAEFQQTSELGSYHIQLQHFNTEGELVHKIEDAFEVREYIPYDIERTAPTRIYPPAPYEVSLDITANRSFEGDITERLPRGFVVVDAGGAVQETLPEYIVLTWKDVVLEEGESMTLSYTFDAPDVSPYLYLLGPLSMDGFEELRQWQIASDALGGIAWLTGTQTTSGTDLNAAASAMLWSTSTVDSYYFSHSTGTEPYRLTINKAGDYFVGLTVPQERTDGNSSRTRIGTEVRVNGVAVPTGYGRSGYIRNASQSESSSHVSFMLSDLDVDDYVEVYLEGLTTIDGGDDVIVSGQAGMYVEYVSPSQTVFAATTTRSVASTSLNEIAASEMQWTETRQDTGFVHSDSVSPEDITISNAGSYFVTVNIPLTTILNAVGNVDERNSILGRVLLDGVQVPAGQFSQGYIRGPRAEDDAESSIHWSGIVTSTTTNQVLSISVEREGNSGEVIVTPGTEGSIFIQEIPSTEIILLRGRDLSGGSDWSNSPAESILWDTQDIYDSGVFTHSTSTDPEQITVDQPGDYLLVYNDALNTNTARANTRITVEVDGTPVSGAQTKSHYTRSATNNETSGSLTFLLSGLSASSVITIFAEQEGANSNTDDSVDAMVMLWKKAELDLRPDTFTFYDTPFDNIRFASTTPNFEFSSDDPDGSSNIQYQFSISSSSDFSASTTRTSGVDTGFENIDTPADSSPFLEGEQIRFKLQDADSLTDTLTYYWRVRARDVGGSGSYGDWSTIQSLTVDSGASTPEWYQSFDGQFDTNVLSTAGSSDNDSLEVDIADNTEILLMYGEGTETTPRYRFWNGTLWDFEQDALDVGGEIYWVRTAAGTARDEYIGVTLDANNDVNAQVYTASTTSWGNLFELTTQVASSSRRGIDVAYETVSGDAVVVACDDDSDPTYSVWNGTSWSATSTINVTTASACNWITMASDPTSDEIIMIHKGVTDDYEAFVWNGSSWGNSQIIGRVGDTRMEGADVMYEESGDQAIVVSTDAGANQFMYTTWDGTEWAPFVLNVALNNDYENGYLQRDEGTDRIAFCLIDGGSDIEAGIWDGDAWSAFTILNPEGNSNQGRPVDCEFETTAGRDGYLMVPYADGSNGTNGTQGDFHQVYDGSTWSGELDGSDINDSYFIQTERAGDGQILALHFMDESADELYSTLWNGTSWSSSEVIEADPASINYNPRYESFSMSARTYQLAVGTAKTNPIDFTFVPNQLTWGDLSFNTTQPNGASAYVQVYYTNTLTCDTLVPDGVITDNSTGILASTTPIDLSGMSTSTYSQICLETTVNASGNNLSSLNDWTLSWVRTPKLKQHAFRWYDNLSAFTPTDPWPAGGDDLVENEIIGSSDAISDGDEIRLRMSLLGSNIDLATSTATFKLQYGSGNSCSVITQWSDVGGIGSSTALWRGFGNAIVGSDWLDEDWGRRIEITIDNSQVDEDVTDFPIYLDLGDLPSGFFANVQSSGQDIRITTDDGMTEVPFEIVDINTGGQTGEVHFKADLASTTDSTFFIYYDNSGASAYAANATYGSENVWTNNFSLRYPLDEDPTGSSPQFLDSTSNSADAVARAGMTGGDVIAGQIGNAINLDGNDGGTFQTPLAYGGEYSISTWWRSTGNGFAVSTNAGADEKIGPWTGGGSNMFFRVLPGGSSDQTVARPSNSVWHHVVITRDSSNKVDFYVDGGSPTRLFSDAAQSGTANWDNFGGQTSQGFNGDMDELRFASVKRSDGWISTEYNNQANPTGFYDVSSEELVSDGRRIPSTLLSESTLRESYEEENNAGPTFNGINVDEIAEWDWVLENNGADAGTSYCFRMVYDDGAILDTYTRYPRLTTNGPPDTPQLLAPFDNEQLASTSPFFEFSAEDPVGDDVAYQIQVDTDYNFGSVDLDRNSVSHFGQFQNLADGNDKNPFSSGATIRFTPVTPLSAGPTTYWWRVRAQDPEASGTYGEWSIPYSFTIDGGTSITTWYQTTQEQFETNDLEQTETNVANDVRVASGESTGTTTSTAIDFDDVDMGNAWGEFDVNETLNGSTITYFLEYELSSDNWSRIPNSALSGNGSGFTTPDFPVNLVSLDTDIYNKIRIVAILDDAGTSPEIDDWTVTWGQRVEQPTLLTPFDNAKVATTSPSFTFFTTDPEDDDLEYEFQISASSSFAASTTYTTVTSSSGAIVQFDLPLALTSSSTYWWRVRARDPLGDNVYSQYADPQSITVDESIAVSTWFQTTNDQFDTNTNTDIETTGNNAQITSVITEAMVAYGEAGSLAPRYRIWNGSSWGEELTAVSINALIEWAVLEAAPGRDEYALGTFGNDNDFNFQIYSGASSTWGNIQELAVDFDYTENSRGFDVAYETVSSDLMAVSCDGIDAVYSIWDGTSWSATTTIDLQNTNDCYWIELASDPTSDEIIMGVRHNIASAVDYELMVWNGSSWGNATTTGAMQEEDSFGLAIEYEESGDQAIVVVSDFTSPSFIWHAWNGSSWTTPSTESLQDDFEWGMLTRDVGTDYLALCYNDNLQDLGIIEWNGSSWDTLTEVTVSAETKDGKPISCQYMTDATNDGDVMIAYTDNNNTANEGGWYNISSGGTVGGANDLNDVEDAWNVQTIRTADDLILAVFFDHNNGDRYDFTYWNGTSWSYHDPTAISITPSVSGNPFTESLSMAARIYPNFDSGKIVSTPIDYDDGTGPRWEQLSFTQTTPGASYINYQVYYDTGTTTVLVPDLYLPGNSIGTTTSPLSLALLDKTVHNEITLEADLVCDTGDCPVLHDWTVEWSEGITVSGTAYEFDETTPQTSGTVAVAVNGVLQAGKTGTIAGDGTWSIGNVTVFEDDTVLVFIDGAVADADEALGATQYDGNGDITGMELSKRHLTIGSDDDTVVVANAGLNGYEAVDNENVFFTIDGSDVLTLCGDTGCFENELKILSGATYQPGANSSVHDFENSGTLALGATTLRVGGSYVNNATTTPGTGTITFTATSSAESISGSSTMNFYNLTFGETSGSASWSIPEGLDVNNILRVTYGTLARATSSITIANNLIIAAGGSFSGLGTTTFDGSGTASWTDTSASSTNIGHVFVDGAVKTVTAGSNVRAQSITIGADDIFRGGTNRTIYITEDFTNNNTFVDDTSTLYFVSTSSAVVTTNGSEIFNVHFAGVGGNWSFAESDIVVANDFTIATGTVTLPSGNTTVRGSFVNSGGIFVHNNGTVLFTATASGKQVGLLSDTFYNAFYNVSFTGSGAWTFIDTNATTTNDLIISNGNVTFPAGTLTVGADVTVSGGGAITHNSGELVLLVQGNDTLTTNGSSLNNVRTRGGVASSWFGDAWGYRVPVTIDASVVDDDLANFPVYVDMADLPAGFFSNVKSDGGDIRVTESDGVTEVPREIVSITTGSSIGELHFRATSISSTTDSTFYIYYGNSGASDYAVSDPYGAENVWSNGYVLVAHMNDLTSSTVLNSANGSFNGTKASAGNPNETATGKLYEAQEDGATDHIAFGNVGGGAGEITISAWFNADDFTPGGDSNTYGATIFSAHTGGNYTWLTAGGTASPDEVRFCAFSSSATCNVSSGSNLSIDTWHYVSAASYDGGAATTRVDGSEVLSFTSDGGGIWNTGSTIGDLRPNRDIEFDGELDEIQISDVVRTIEWQDATYRNQATTTDFYTPGAQEVAAQRVFSDTNLTVLGDMVLETGGDSVFPSGTLSVGGSFDNDAEFDANSGTVEFDSVAGAETIASGNSSFATLTFNSATGDFTVTEHATATSAVVVTNVSDFTLNTGLTLESLGTFANTANGASTTWTGSIVRLSSGTDYSINASTDTGDDYATLDLTGDTDVAMWNSSASVYSTQNTSSLYSQDHDGVDGDLYIFGDYSRVSGTEHWSYATDFDGTALGGSSRQVDVRIEGSGTLTFGTSTLSILGSVGASTTVDAQSGTYALTTAGATVTAQYFHMTGTDTSGLNLTSSTTVTLLDDALFTIAGGSSAITVDATTVDTNPASQFFNTNFVTGGGSVNVDLSGTPSSYWWFRDGQGDRYGESFDNVDGDPGAIRWDDSSYNIVVSGTIYANDEGATLGGPTCDGFTNNVRIVVDGGTYTSATSCSGANGSYSFPTVAYVGDPSIIVYLDTTGGVQGSTITKTPTADITDMDVYANRVTVRHEDTAAMTIAGMAVYDNTNDNDIQFTAATGTTNVLTVLPDTELHVFATTTFTPGGPITLTSGGSGATYDGSLHIANGATFTGAGTTTHSIGGSLQLGSAATFVPASTTVVMTATTSGKTITSDSGATISFNELQFTGAGGSWNVNTDILLTADMEVATGTVTGTGDVTLQNGSLFGDGLVSFGGGTTLLERSNTFGGAQAWTVNNLTLGNGSIVGTTTPAGNATTTVSGTLTIATGHYLDAGSSQWSLAGSGSAFVETGTFLEDTSTVTYSGSSDATILSTDYYNLRIATDAGTPTFTFGSLGINVLNDFVVAGSVTTVATLTTNDPVMQVDGDVYIGANGSLLASDSVPLTVLGSWDNDGSLTGNGGEIDFVSSDAFTIAAGTGSFADLTISGSGAMQFTENATSTGTLTFEATSNPTVNSGVTLAVGTQFAHQTDGANTTWTGSILSLYGGDYEVNASTTADTYDTLRVENGAEVRTWNSSASTTVVASGSSLYSMDHADVTGDLYIFGDYQEETRSDYWSYATDFDGTDLSGGNERTVDVYVVNGGSVTYTGGSLAVVGTTGATTTIQNQGSGTYQLHIGGTSAFNGSYLQIRDIDSNGLTFSGTPTVTDLANADFLVEISSASAVTVGGTVIDANPAKNFQNNIFNDDIGVTGAVNITATGTTVSSWRNTNHLGDIAGESFDDDPADDPGYLVWDDSAAIITISGNVYQSNTASVSSVCDDTTKNIRLAVDGVLTASASSSCASADGAYSISGVSFSPNDTLTLFIEGEAVQAANVSIDPVSSIGNMHLYENHVIVRHENTDPITIADMDDFDTDDAGGSDVPFTAEVSGTHSVTLPANFKLVIWNNKEFEPGGDVLVVGGGAGTAYDGTVELYSGATFTANNGEAHTIGGSFILGSGATFDAAQSTITFTTTGAARTIDMNDQAFFDVVFNGSGSWTLTDTTFTVDGDATISSGALTLPTGTSTFAGNFENTGGSFNANSGNVYFTATDAGNQIELGGSDVATIEFDGVGGSWSFTDTNATSTGNVVVTNGTVTLPGGILSVGGDFINADTLNANSGTVKMTDTEGSSVVTLTSEDLYSLLIAGGASFTMTDASATLLGDLTIASGTLAVSTTTLTIGGSLDAINGIMDTASGTILFNSADGGETINPGTNNFYNVVFGSAGGGWTMQSATTTNNFTLSAANAFTLASGQTLAVENVFTNAVGGTNTTWANSTLKLNAGIGYSINTKASGGDAYNQVIVAPDTDIRSWDSSFATLTVDSTASVYSQDNASVAGDLYIYGDFHIATTTEYWSYATDFDGTALGGSSRQANVYFANGATTTVDGATLNVVGAVGATTTIQAIVNSHSFAFAVSAGTLNATYYSLENTNLNGLYITGTPTISNLANGAFLLTADTGAAVTITSEALNANASKIFNNVGFSASSSVTGYNVALISGTTSNAWKFTNAYGDISGELFDSDGATNCGSIRWDYSSCLLVDQTHYRWRNDDGGLGVPNNEWLNASWGKRKRVRVENQDNQLYSSTTVKMTVTYDADMRSDFEDLRFTDSDGLTEVPYWVERYTASTDALVWVTVPTLGANDTTDLYMYYDNALATTTASSGATFIASDDFEDGNDSEYSGDTGIYTVDGSFAYGGSYGLDATGFESTRATDGIGRTDQTVSQGEIIRYMQYVVSGSSDEACTLFGIQSVTGNTNYGVCLELFGTERMTLARRVESTDNYGALVVPLASTTYTYSTGWYEVEIDWQTNNTIDVSLFNSAGTLVATTSAVDSTYTSGGFGFTSWGQNGGWDSFTSRVRVDTAPQVSFGAEQVSGGATWNRALDVASTGFEVGDVARLRIAVENSGLDITDQEFLLEYASKGAAPSCEAVSAGSYVAVPNQASCGSSPLCMVTTTNYDDDDATFDLLEDTSGTFTAGKAVESPSGLTTVLDVDQNEYTEIEYALSSTVNATEDAYCLRVTDNGSDLDSYASVAEFALQFDPSVGDATLNGGADISLLPGATTTVYATATVTDFNGYADLTYATSTIYRSGAGAACVADNNNCYISTAPQCTFTDCSGNSCEVSCSADIYYHADATDVLPYEGEEWLAFIEVGDAAGGIDIGSAPSVELLTLQALDANNAIAYGALAVSSSTGAYNPTTTIQNIGNVAIDINLEGTDLSDGGSSAIPASQQLFATSSFSYSSCVYCTNLSTSTISGYELDLTKPTTTSPAVEDTIYWGIAIPFGVASNPHSGVNTFYAVSDI